MHDISPILIVAAALTFALFFGAITNRLGLSPIVGYLLAGVVVGPHTPWFFGDSELAVPLAMQLAEIGVILLMFGVGLHFNFGDLARVQAISLPGAVVQSTVATILATGVTELFGMPLTTGFLLGVAISVTSTVVLIRVLEDFGVLHTRAGHISIGWLVVEDLFTILVLVVMPVFKEAGTNGSLAALPMALIWTAGRIALLVVLVLVVGKRVVPWLMNTMARTRSRELFTLSVLTVALGIAAGSAEFLGVSMALGAFLAGMVVGQSDVSHQAASDALPFRDAFSVLFFVSVGMIFNPSAAFDHAGLTLAILAVILIGKPLAALGIMVLLRQPIRTALTATVALAQIGEFSFILGDEARALGYLSEADTGVLVSCALVSITLNPILFRLVAPAERWILAHPKLRRWLAGRREDEALSELDAADAAAVDSATSAVVVGYGPVGQTLTRILRDFKIDPVVIDLNVDTVRRLRSRGLRAVYGDASREEILRAARVQTAEFLLVTLPDQEARLPIVEMALELKPDLKILVRAHYNSERTVLECSGVTAVAYEEAEVAVALAELLLQQIGVPVLDVQARAAAIRDELAIHPHPVATTARTAM